MFYFYYYPKIKVHRKEKKKKEKRKKIDCKGIDLYIVYWPIEKRLNVNNVIIIIKSVFNEDKSHYHCKILLEKSLYQSAKTLSQFFFIV